MDRTWTTRRSAKININNGKIIKKLIEITNRS